MEAMARVEIEIEADSVLHDRLSADFYFVEARDHIMAPAVPGRAAYIVARVSGLSVKIWADEHPPPHFHVSYQGQDASFSILDCRRLPGVKGLERYESTIRHWWGKNTRRLITVWNETRPTDCPVGPIAVPEGEDPQDHTEEIIRQLATAIGQLPQSN